MNNNKGFLKGVLFALLAIYVISPLDLAPGVADDLLLILLSAVTNMKGNSNQTLPQDIVEGSWQK